MHTHFSEILKELQKNKALAQITIIEHNGSTPRTAGTKMLVREDGSIFGTVGGGLYEAKAITQAKELIHLRENLENKDAFILYFDMKTKQNTTDMDMICGGDLRLLVEYIAVDDTNRNLYTLLCESKNHVVNFITRITNLGTNASLALNNATQIDTSSTRAQSVLSKEDFISQKVVVEHALLHEKNEPINPHILSDSLRTELEKDLRAERKNIFLQNHEFCFHAINTPHRLHIFGAGHVSFELAKLTDYLGFSTYVLDDRAEFSNPERFSSANTLVLSSLDEANVLTYLSQYEIGEQDGLIIVTRGHARDRDVLMSCLKTKAGYIGMIGSRSKRQATYQYLLNNGYKKEDFERIFSPIGLSIGAQSPQEISISISAQLIQWRAHCLHTETRYA